MGKLNRDLRNIFFIFLKYYLIGINNASFNIESANIYHIIFYSFYLFYEKFFLVLVLYLTAKKRKNKTITIFHLYLKN